MNDKNALVLILHIRKSSLRSTVSNFGRVDIGMLLRVKLCFATLYSVYAYEQKANFSTKFF